MTVDPRSSIATGMTMADLLGRHARTIPDHLAFGLGDVRRSYRELDERVSRLSNALRDRGVGRGDRVLVLGYNTLEYVEAYFATARLGAICVPVNFRLVADEIAYVLQDSGASAAVVQATFAPLLVKAQEIADRRVTCLVNGGRVDGLESYDDALAQASPDFVAEVVHMVDPAVIMYTSGTTGKPKGAVLIHAHFMLHTFSMMLHLGMPKDDRVFLSIMPLFHIGGLMSLLPQLMIGGTNLMVPSGNFDPNVVVDLIETERVTSCVMVPTMMQAVCDVPDIDERDLSCLGRIGWGAAPATTHLLKQLNDTLPHVKVESTFGQTECGPIITVLQGEDQLRKLGSVGTPMINVEVRVVDDDMNDVAQGEIGEAVYRTPFVMAEYWNRPDATAEAFRGGWFHSGDLVRQDEDGYFYVVDRKKDMIISGGENIYCAEVENVIAGQPKVHQVALIGIPDEKWGETPLAIIIAKDPADPPTPEEIAAWCTERLARYKRPKNVVYVDELPRNPSGKVLKNQLRVEHQAGKFDMLPA